MIKTYRLAGLCLFLCFIHPQVFAVHNGLLGTLPVTISSPDSPIVVAPGGTITFTMTAHPSLPGRLLPLGFKVGFTSTIFSVVGGTCTTAPGGSVTRPSIPSSRTCTLDVQVEAGTPLGNLPLNIQIFYGGRGDNNGVDIDVTMEVDVENASIEIEPTSLTFLEGSTGQVTVTNSEDSNMAAIDVGATIPGESGITQQSSSCSSSLPVGDSCVITFSASESEGPTTIPITGSNTNTKNVEVTVTAKPIITIISPIQTERVVKVAGQKLTLGIENAAGGLNATEITVSNKAGCGNLEVVETNCNNVSPGNTCSLVLGSNTPYAPCNITISGSNTADPSPTTHIAFYYKNGLVFDESGKVVQPGNEVIEISSQWTSSNASTGATSRTDGESNTGEIVAHQSCSGDPDNCAAQQCQNIPAGVDNEWYLPSLVELTTINTQLCPQERCNFGYFSEDAYWSSTETSENQAATITFPAGSGGFVLKDTKKPVRCVRKYALPSLKPYLDQGKRG